MRSYVLVSVLSALACALSLTTAAPVGEENVSISYIDRIVTETVTVTAPQGNPGQETSKISLNNWAAASPTGITVLSQDATTAIPPAAADITSQYPAMSSGSPTALTATTNLQAQTTTVAPVVMPSRVVTNSGYEASATGTPPASETIPGGGYSVTPSSAPSGTLSAGLPVATPAVPVDGAGCQATRPAARGQGKAGLGWTKDSGSCIADFAQSASKISWTWNWAHDRGGLPTELDFVPVLFNGDNDTIQDFKASVQTWDFGVSSVMGLYEPHVAERGNTPPDQAARIHQDVINTFEGVYKIGGPIMSQDATGTFDAAKKWYTDFYVACQENCRIDFLPLAVYGTDHTRTIGEITEWYNLFGASLSVPIWIVEYDCRDLAAATTCSPEAAASYARAVTDWADATEWVERYAWFDTFVAASSGNANSLVTGNGTLSELGQWYAYGDGAQQVLR